MSVRDDKTYYAALARLENGESPQTIADTLGVSYASVLRWRREFAEAKDAGNLDKLIDMDSLILATAAAGIEAPQVMKEEAIANLTRSMSGLQMLQESMQTTALYLVQQIKSQASRVEHVSELVELSNGLCALNNSFFNSNKTQVNVQNNYTTPGEGGKYGNFLSDEPRD